MSESGDRKPLDIAKELVGVVATEAGEFVKAHPVDAAACVTVLAAASGIYGAVSGGMLDSWVAGRHAKNVQEDCAEEAEAACGDATNNAASCNLDALGDCYQRNGYSQLAETLDQAERQVHELEDTVSSQERDLKASEGNAKHWEGMYNTGYAAYEDCMDREHLMTQIAGTTVELLIQCDNGSDYQTSPEYADFLVLGSQLSASVDEALESNSGK